MRARKQLAVCVDCNAHTYVASDAPMQCPCGGVFTAVDGRSSHRPLRDWTRHALEAELQAQRLQSITMQRLADRTRYLVAAAVVVGDHTREEFIEEAAAAFDATESLRAAAGEVS